MSDAAGTSSPIELADVLARLVAALDAGHVEPEGLDPSAAARYLGISVSKIHAMNAAGAMPKPAELGDRCPRWARSELRAWLLAGSPSRLRWQAMRDAAIRRVG